MMILRDRSEGTEEKQGIRDMDITCHAISGGM
jgi:hypothetical protein